MRDLGVIILDPSIDITQLFKGRKHPLLKAILLFLPNAGADPTLVSRHSGV